MGQGTQGNVMVGSANTSQDGRSIRKDDKLLVSSQKAQLKQQLTAQGGGGFALNPRKVPSRNAHQNLGVGSPGTASAMLQGAPQ